MNKEQVKQSAFSRFNNPNNFFTVEVNGDDLIFTWNWKNATLFGMTSISQENREYKYIITLFDNNKYKDRSIDTNKNINVSPGNISFGNSLFTGKQFGVHKEIGIGRNNQTNETGVQMFDFDTRKIQKPVQNFLNECGYTKKGIFG